MSLRNEFPKEIWPTYQVNNWCIATACSQYRLCISIHTGETCVLITVNIFRLGHYTSTNFYQNNLCQNTQLALSVLFAHVWGLPFCSAMLCIRSEMVISLWCLLMTPVTLGGRGFASLQRGQRLDAASAIRPQDCPITEPSLSHWSTS